MGCLVILSTAGCRRESPDESDVVIQLTTTPSPPAVGPSTITLRLHTSDGIPLEGAEVEIEGNMNHAGMRPSLATLKPTQPGTYAGTLDFTMAGDWFVLVTVRASGRPVIERKIDVPGVRVP